MSVLQINDNDIIDPQTMTGDLYDLDSEDGARRNQRGEMFRDRVAVKRKVNCTWGPRSGGRIVIIRKLTAIPPKCPLGWQR